MRVCQLGVQSEQQSTLDVESAQPCPRSPVSCFGRDSEVAQGCSPATLDLFDHPAGGIEASKFEATLIKPFRMPSRKTGEEHTAPVNADELLNGRTNVDELLSSRSHRGRLCGLLPALSLGALVAVDQTSSVELYTARAVEEVLTARSEHVDLDFLFLFDDLLAADSDHVALELPSLAMMAQSGVYESALPEAFTPRGATPSQEDIDLLARTNPTDTLPLVCGVLDSIIHSPAVAEAPSMNPAKPVRAPPRVVPKSGLQERLQALAAAGLMTHAAAAVPHQDSSDDCSSSSSTTARSFREHAASRKGSIGDDVSGACEAEGAVAGQMARALASPTPPSVRQGFADPASTKIGAERLRKFSAEGPDSGVMVDPQMKEMYLSDEEFEQIFAMAHVAFARMAKWKQHALKKQHGLF